jgi:OmcA/MtrC family decaheme c-type cytochrome
MTTTWCRWNRLLGVFLGGVLVYIAGCSEGDETTNVTVIESETPPGDGLTLQITSVQIPSDLLPEVEFTLVDGAGVPVKIEQLDGVPRWVLARINVDPSTNATTYQAYSVNSVAGATYTFEGAQHAPALAQADQVVTDSEGTNTLLEPGKYRYKFTRALPADYPTSATHSLGVFASRMDRTFVANTVLDFVPAGGTPPVTRQVVTTAACNQCHDPLAFHGGARRELALCVLCHTNQTVDPETGESLEFEHMVHKIHRGSSLHNLPYYIVGNRQSIADYSTVGFPREIRECTTCHQGTNADNYRMKPSRAACGSCHDDVNFQTGAGHDGNIQQFDDLFCKNCHAADQVVEFDNTVPGAHVVPYSSSFNPQLTLEITEVTGMTPDGTPSVRFKVSTSAGPTDITTLNRVAVVFAGPTTDYSQLIAQNNFTIQGGGAVPTLVTNAVGDYTFTPDGYKIPADAVGSWSVGMESRAQPIPVGAPGEEVNVNFGSNNPVVHVDLAAGTLGAGSPTARRAVVENAKCDRCHLDLRFHGNLRTDVAYCVLCHSLWTTDEARRPGLDPAANPPETIDFKHMIHRIHRGEDLENSYVIYGFGNTPTDFKEIRFPGDLRNCEGCHLEETFLLPPPSGAEATVVNIAGTPVPQDNAVRTPSTAACTGCHDGDDTFAHTRVNSIVEGPDDWAESCAVCHGDEKIASVSAAHAR